MSEKKRKPKVIHVDKLIVKADEVIIHDEGNHHVEEKQEEPKEVEVEVRRDPWGFFGPNTEDTSEDNDQKSDNDQGEKNDESEEASENDEPRGFSWF